MLGKQSIKAHQPISQRVQHFAASAGWLVAKACAAWFSCPGHDAKPQARAALKCGRAVPLQPAGVSCLLLVRVRRGRGCPGASRSRASGPGLRGTSWVVGAGWAVPWRGWALAGVVVTAVFPPALPAQLRPSRCWRGGKCRGAAAMSKREEEKQGWRLGEAGGLCAGGKAGQGHDTEAVQVRTSEGVGWRKGPAGRGGPGCPGADR